MFVCVCVCVCVVELGANRFFAPLSSEPRTLADRDQNVSFNTNRYGDENVLTVQQQSDS